ncbi:hypothetical protein DH2020_037816 [Rehmannia glutinosa]|uniref:Glucose-6-phosphate 1-epimerase n=1 Tax=Rehmannia glutinosa TaxID=99300 RepID=A0ABR0V1V2_REHGL
MATAPMTWSLSPTTSAVRFNWFDVDFSAMASEIENADYVKVTQGLGDLQKVVLTCVHGSEAEVYLYGGCATSWKVDGKDLLFVRPDTVFTGYKPIRNMNWSLVNSDNVEGNPCITLELKDGPYSRSMWDYSFHALYKVTLDRNTLSTEIKITNTDEKPFSFTTALHTYFRASAVETSVRGLKGCKTLNKDPDPKNPVEGKEERDVVTFPGFVDCIFLDVPGELNLDNGLGDLITIKNTNWSDAVLWNPHLAIESCYKDFLFNDVAVSQDPNLLPSADAPLHPKKLHFLQLRDSGVTYRLGCFI